MKDQSSKRKTPKDLSFILVLPKTQVDKGITKYLMREGQGEVLRDIKVPFTLNFTLIVYDYTGMLLERIQRKYTSKETTHIENGSKIDQTIQSMKSKEKAWFNIQIGQKGSSTCQGFHGYHYQIETYEITYKDAPNFASKEKVYEANRSKAAEAFHKGKYKVSIDYYIHSINILSHLSKKHFTPQELGLLRQFRVKTQNNLLKCVAKLCGVGGRYDAAIGQIADRISLHSLNQSPESLFSYYQRGAYFNYCCRFSDAEEVIKQGLKKEGNESGEENLKQKNSLKKLMGKVNEDRQRQVRHLEREEKRRKKLKLLSQTHWDSDSENQMPI